MYMLALICADYYHAVYATLRKWIFIYLWRNFDFELHQLVSPVTPCTLGTRIKVVSYAQPHARALLLLASVMLSPSICSHQYSVISGLALCVL